MACRICDLSTTGMSLKTSESLAPGMVVRVAFHLPNGLQPVEVSGSVVRQSGGRAESTLGLQFVQPDLEAVRAIQTFVSRNRTDGPFSRRPGRPDTGEVEVRDGERELRSLYQRAVDDVAERKSGRRGLLERLLRRGR